MAAEIQERDAQRQLLALIRDFAAEQSQGERRISDLQNQMLELQKRLEMANTGLEDAKRSREAAENVLRGSEVELSMADASVHALEARTRLLQEQVSVISSDFSSLKNEEESFRDKFFSEMYELNKEIRNFRESESFSLKKDNNLEEGASIPNYYSQLQALEEKYQEELATHAEAVQLLADVEKRVFIGESVLEQTKQMKELSRYPDRRFTPMQTAESEQIYAALGSEIQKQYTCPKCKVNNMGAMEDR